MCPGQKFDDDKLRYDLIEPGFLRDLAAVMTMGAAKYEAENWKLVSGFEARYTAALMRHTEALRAGEVFDQESKIQHTAHIAANAMFLHYYQGIVNHENTDVRRHESKDDPVDRQTRFFSTDCDETDDDHRAIPAEACLRSIISVLNGSGTHEYNRACLYDILDMRGFTKLAGTVDTP